jgi:GH35 family endo-1,4-beta-xylanase
MLKSLWLFAAALLLTTRTTSAQESTDTLRGLASELNFYVGAAVGTYNLTDAAFSETLSREFNMLTPENEAKMCSLQARRGVFDFNKLDQLMDFAAQYDMTVRGHTLVWHNCLPDWVANGNYTRDEAIGLLRDYIMTVVGRYKGRIPIWDVVNEAIADNAQMRDTPWRHFIGDDYVEMAFRFAHEADPDALLFYNDYNADGINAKSDAIYAMVQDFVARGVPILGVGLQAHVMAGDIKPGGRISTDSVAQNIARFGELGLQVQITEMDSKYPGETSSFILERQANDYRNLLDACLSNPACTAFVVWGVTDKYSWLRSPRWYDNPDVQPLLFDDDYAPKPGYFAMLDVLRLKINS